MFSGCTSLTEAPELPATKLAEMCYLEMFKGCTNLNYIKVGVLTLDNNFDATKDWVDGIDGKGTFIFPCGSKYDKHGASEVPTNFTIVSSPIVVFENPDGEELYRDTIGCDVLPVYRGKTPTYGEKTDFKGWNPELTIHDTPGVYYYKAVYDDVAPEENNWLCFTAEQAGSSVRYLNGADNKPNVEYSLDGKDWLDWPAQTAITLERIGDKVYVRGNNPDGFSHEDLSANISDLLDIKCSYFQMKGSIAASGSVMSLIDGKGVTTTIPCEYCFNRLFYQCGALTTPPVLPATELASGCYNGMFFQTGIKETPKLPATKLADNCYMNMFGYCSNLTVAPELPATTLEESCYTNMLAGTNITEAPKLPATEMKRYCYSNMFAYCEKLTKAPELPATVLDEYCYWQMFIGCVSLKEAPELPASKLVANCYQAMFKGCTSLNYIKVGVMSLKNNFDATTDWVDGINGDGLFIFPCGSKYDVHGKSQVPTNFTIISSPIVIFQNPNGDELYRDTIGCDVMPVYRGNTPTYGECVDFNGWDPVLTIHDTPGIYYYTATYNDIPVTNWLCFKAEVAGSEVWYQNARANNPDVQISYDGKTWKPLAEKEVVSLANVGDSVFFRGDNPKGFSSGMNSYSYFNMNGLISASGSVMSLIDNKGVTEVIPSDSCFYELFKYCSSLTQAPELTATTLTKGCYTHMFWKCTNLVKAPDLPAVEVAPYCYEDMFNECTNLTIAPVLPAVKMENNCYRRMFYGCKSLTEAPALPAMDLANACYAGMFSGCVSLVKAPDLPAQVLKKDCYMSLFYGCESLVNAPALPAMTLAEFCYAYMFGSCVSLEIAPLLPATQWADFCYWYMFEDCTSLNYMEVAVLSLDIHPRATEKWVKNVDGPGLFVFPCGSKYDKHGASEVPENFKIKSSPIVVFVNPDETELYRDTIGCDVVPEYKGETPTYGEGLVFKGWDKELTILKEPDVYYFTAVYEEKTPETGNWLCFTAETDDSEVWYENEDGNSVTVEYSLDGGVTWQSLVEKEKVLLKEKGQKVYFRGDNPTGFSHVVDSKIKFTRFRMTGLIAASGSVMSLLDGDGSSTAIPNDFCFGHLFRECSALTTAPELPATYLTKECYAFMFDQCTNLVEAPVLPATTLANGCYLEMFRECYKLQVAPKLPATTMVEACYSDMFADCISLISAPKLPATELAEDCYFGMFAGCVNLKVAPELPATTLAEYCYGYMFRSCPNLTDAPALPATTLANSCYYAMFEDCRSLTKAPELPATSLMKDCYFEMFTNCSSLNYIKVGVMSLDNDVNATSDWVKGIDGEGVFIFPCGSTYDKHGISEVPENFTIISSPIIVFQNPDGEELYRDTIGCDVVPEYKGKTPTYGEGLVFKGWDKELTIHEKPDTYYYTAVYGDDVPVQGNWLCFTAEEDNSVVFYMNVGNNHPNVMYSVDGGITWNPLQEEVRISLEKSGDKVYLKGDNPNGFSKDENNYTHIWTIGSVSASGSVMSLIDGEGLSTVIPNDYCFYHLFAASPALIKAPELPATELKKSCYEGMFVNCVVLENVPALPATTLEDGCYKSMFELCYKIKETPVLPATTLAKECYYKMFLFCKGLNNASQLPATIMAESCYASMFYGCENLKESPVLPATHLAKNCYNAMFWNCYNLEKAPALPATELAESCYNGMFNECRNLTQAPALPAVVMKSSCYENMFSGCRKILEAPELPATILAEYCYLGMFAGCENLTKAPELPARELSPECYMDMFEGCTNITYIKVGVLSLDNDFDATLNWVDGIDKEGTFIFPCGSKYDKHGVSEVPDNFKIISSPVVVFQNPDGTELYRDTIACDVVAEYKGETPTYGEGLVFKGWDPELTIHDTPDTYYYTAVYDETTPQESNWLCFTAEEAGSQLWYQSDNLKENITIQYSIDDGKTWQTLKPDEKITLENIKDKVYLKGNNPEGLNGDSQGTYRTGCQFQMDGRIAASGSVMSLIDETGTSTIIPCKHCFEYMFAGCDNLTHAPELPATTLTDSCYSSMFMGCGLIQAPELPATTLAEGCYQDMFEGCVDLLEMPELPATTLTKKCYEGMFNHCKSLTYVVELPAKTMADFCYERMFLSCSSLTKAPELPATELARYCYSAMFLDCSNLTEAPQLSATQLADDCYSQMFFGCTKLTQAPELPATRLVDECYSQMFYGCISLNYIKVGVMSLDNDVNATSDWVKGIDGEGVFIFPCGSKYDKHGISEVPDNFTIISSPIIVFQNPDGTELYRDTIGCDVVAEYKGETPTYGEGLTFKGWDKELTIHEIPDTYYYTAVYDEEGIFDVSKCLCFTAEKANSIISYRNAGGNSPDVQYSADEGKTWQTWAENEALILRNVGEKIYVRGNNPEGFSHMANFQKSDDEETGQYTNFKMSGEIAASGSVMSLIDGKGESLVIPCDYCFAHLFDGQRNLQKQEDIMTTALVKAPELPATTLTKGCYLDMFGTCDLLKEAPVLPATELAPACYFSMFNNCRKLEDAPALPSTKLSDYCYEGMFANSGISVAPELPATELADSCYWGMFLSCKNLELAPDLLATELKPGCYEKMFAGCSNLNYIKVGVMTLDNDFDATKEWVTGVNGPGTFIFPCGSKYDKHGISEVPDNFIIISSPIIVFQNPDGEELYRDTIGCDVVAEYKGETPTYGEGLVFKGWDKELTIHEIPDTYYYTAVYEEETMPETGNWLCFTAERDECEVWYVNSIDNVPDVQYSVDGGRTWNPLAPEEHVVLNLEGDKVYFRGYNPSGFSHSQDYTMMDVYMLGQYTHFEMTGTIAGSGSVMSLIDGVGETTVIPNDNCFYKLFEDCSSLIQAPELPATTLKESCYEEMFSMCMSLTQAPELPATTLATSCYSEMFKYCISLTEAPELPATTLASKCYSEMFSYCMDLTEAPELPATELAEACYYKMFSTCNKLTEAPKLIATTLADRCYDQMFFDCPSLQTAPELPATTLTYRCYDRMFAECTSLINAPELPATELANSCYRGMFSGCTRLTTAPELPAPELVEGCYEDMFKGCSSLNYIKVGVMTLDNDFEYGATDNWVSGVDGPGVFIFPCGSTYDKHGVSEVPDNFEILRGPVLVIFQNPDSTVLWKDTIDCDEVPEYKGETPSMGEDYFFIGWDKEFTEVGDVSVYYITAMYEDLNKYESLHLTVDDNLYLVLPGGSETIGYELLEGGGSRYEIWCNGEMITEGAVTNDSTVQLICPEEFTPGSYTATLVMYDAQNGRGACDFVFHVMLKDDPTNSYYVKVWNDVVICRNGDNKFVSYQWYKNRKLVEGATLQYYNDVELLDGEYLIYVTDQTGKSYFIEPKRFEREEASYSIAAEPSIANRGADFKVVVSGVAPEQLKYARIVVYRNDGVVANILDDVETENEMHLSAIGDYVIVLTVNDGKNANCKVLIK